LAGLTAYQSLKKLEIENGSKILILAGSGGVGTLAIQLAKNYFHASQIATTASGNKRAQLQQLGATTVIDYKNEDFTKIIHDFDAVLDGTGETNSAFSVLKPNGIVLSLPNVPQPSALEEGGFTISNTTKALLMTMCAPTELNAKARGVQYQTIWVRPNADDLNLLTQLIEEKKLKPVIDKFYEFNQVNEAFKYLETGAAFGKIVIHIADDNTTSTSTA